MRDVITFQGRSVDELRQEFRISVDEYMAWCAERGKEPDKPFSGKFVVRVDPQLHSSVTLAAQMTGKSLNAWVTECLALAVADRTGSPKRRASALRAREPKG